nr:hypothetical protein [Branchiibius sp. NY16-3462-2]
MEPEPPRSTGRKELLGSGQPAQGRFHQHQGADAIGSLQGQEKGGRHTRIDGHHVDGRVRNEVIDDGRQVAGQGAGVVPRRSAATAAHTPQIRCDDAAYPAQQCGQRFPQPVGVRPAVHEQHCVALPRDGHAEPHVGFNLHVN